MESSLPIHDESPHFSVANLSVYIRRRAIIRDFSLEVRSGTLVWITGENGAGKSALIRVFARRGNAVGSVSFSPAASRSDVAYYSPLLGVPAHVSVGAWFGLMQNVEDGRVVDLGTDDPLVAAVARSATMTRLSTGEAKRLLLWAVLRVPRTFTFLDEPYDHLSPPARQRLTEILFARARSSIVVVATNQDIPDMPNKHIVAIDR
jgi:ABC-type Mn2+/Zn2+ transport system ATPase subunit